MYKPWSSTTAVPPRPLDRPVWVDLDRLYGEPDETGAGVDDPPPGGYLKATGRVPGLLKRWARAVDGGWFGRVDFSVCDSYGPSKYATKVLSSPLLRSARGLSSRVAST
jgi:hypothetical protein